MHFTVTPCLVLLICLSHVSAVSEERLVERINAAETLIAAEECEYIPVGTILPFGGSQTPDGMLPCDGSLRNKSDYKELYAAIGNAFTAADIQKAGTQFQLPDLRGRMVIGSGQGANGGVLSTRTLGGYLGVEKHLLSLSELPSHSHYVNDPGHYHTYTTYPTTGSSDTDTEYYIATSWYTAKTGASVTGISIATAGANQQHENVPPSGVINFVIKAGAYTPSGSQPAPIPPPPYSPWPQPKNVLGYWPLNTKYMLQDIGPSLRTSSQQRLQTTTGPFGAPDAAVVPAVNGAKVLEVNGFAVDSSFTVSLFLRTNSQNSGNLFGGIFEFVDQFRTDKAFQVRHINRTTIEVSANAVTIGQYTMVQQLGAWTFIAMVFDGITSKFTVYGKHGVVSPPSIQMHVLSSLSFNNNGIRLGFASRWNQGLRTSDAVSCLMVYSTALSAAEVKQAYESCRFVQGTVPCGSPKLGLQPIPSSTTLTAIPKPGQFPFIASLRKGLTHICSASIVDEYWLLTSANCFTSSSDPSAYSIYVGVYDLNVTEMYTKRHTCAKIIVPTANKSARDLALVQVTEPIDFANDYVNDACLLLSKDASTLKPDLTQFVFGWGINGRQPLTSQTVGRYVPGLAMTDAQCLQAWDSQSYVPKKDFCFMSSSKDKNVPCSGDEGSALLMQSHAIPDSGTSDQLIQFATFYSRNNTCSVTSPGLFTNIAEYGTWILDQIACTVPGHFYPGRCPQS